MTDETERLAVLQADIAARLRGVCSHLSEESFQELVRDVAVVRLKYDRETEAAALPLRRPAIEAPDDPGAQSGSGFR